MDDYCDIDDHFGAAIDCDEVKRGILVLQQIEKFSIYITTEPRRKLTATGWMSWFVKTARGYPYRLPVVAQ